MPTIQGVIVVVTLIVVALNLLVDLLYAWADPRIRLAWARPLLTDP